MDKNDVHRWVFKLRRGVKFHDGSDFNADAVIWNWDKIRNKEAPQYDTKQASEVALTDHDDQELQENRRLHRRISHHATIELRAVPAHLRALQQPGPVGQKLARTGAPLLQTPGTGPFKMARFVPRERAEYEPNTAYWDKNRMPKVDRRRAAPYARTHHTPGRPAYRPGGLDRSPATRRDSPAQAGWFPDRPAQLPARLAL
mgnify:CR=1 FL=1